MSTDEDGPARTRERYVRLYRTHLPQIRAYARRRAPDSVAEDVVAETFLIAWRRADQALTGGLPWLYATARNVLRNQLRSDRRREVLAARLAGLPVEHVPDDADRVADRTALVDAIRRLSEPEQEVLLLVYWEHLDVAAVARVVGCRPGTAAVRLHRARRRLRDALSQPEPDARAPRASAPPTPIPVPRLDPEVSHELA
ncbi:RNA polymerase sigma factor [Mumia sp. DW29H23]|uniref:RNA polymerase sigma factor n=1 Tax=Mumia sp. DW29H23 TaxID=3421241 RepID=UPI003D685383